MPRLEYDVVFNLDTSSVSTLKDELNEISSGRGLESVSEDAKDASQSIERTEKDVNNLSNALQQARNKSERFSNASQGVANSTGAMSKSVNNSNQILFSFGDAMQDGAQFQQGFASGARAIGNNLTFASEQIALANQKTGGWRATMKSLGGALLGPAGIVFGVNALVTAITVLPSILEESTTETKSFREELKKAREELDLLSPRLSSAKSAIKEAFPDDTELESLRKQQQALTSIEAQLLSRRDELRGTEENQLDGLIEKAERRLEITKASSTELQRLVNQGVIKRSQAEAIVNNRLEVQRRAQSQLNKLKEEDASVTESIQDVQKDQISVRSEIKQTEAFLNSEYGKQLNQIASINRKLKAQEDLARARRNAITLPEDKIFDAEIDTTFTEDEPITEFGSINDLERQLANLKEKKDNISPIKDEFSELGDEITRVENKLESLKNESGSASGIISSQFNKAFSAISQGASQLTSSLTQLTTTQIEGRIRTAEAANASDQKIEQLERERFEAQKKGALANAVINTAEGITSALTIGNPALAITQAALVGAAGAAQIAAIKAQEFGGGAQSTGSTGGSQAQEGFTTSDFSRSQSEPNASVARDASNTQPDVVIEAKNILPDTEFSRRAERGRKQRETDAIVVNKNR